MESKTLFQLCDDVVQCLEDNKNYCNYDAIKEVSLKNKVSHIQVSLAYSQYKKEYQN